MNVKVLTLSILLAIIFIASTPITLPVQPIPTNRDRCNICHSGGGAGSISVTYLDGSRPKDNIFKINQGETIAIVLYGLGAQDQLEPGVALIFDPVVLHHITVEGALPGGEGSYAYYVRDGQAEDHDPDVSNVKGILELTIDETIPPGEYNLVASYLQAGPSGLNVDLLLKVLELERKTSSISLLVTPLTAYANKDSIYISGGIRPSDAENVIIEVRTTEEWRSLAVLSPQREGKFFYEWRPSEIEEYSVRVRFEGNKNYEPVESEVFTVSVQKAPETLINQLFTGLLLGMLVILIGVGLFYRAGRSRYLRKVSGIKSL